MTDDLAIVLFWSLASFCVGVVSGALISYRRCVVRGTWGYVTVNEDGAIVKEGD